MTPIGKILCDKALGAVEEKVRAHLGIKGGHDVEHFCGPAGEIMIALEDKLSAIRYDLVWRFEEICNDIS